MILVAIPFFAFAAALVLAGLSQTFNAQHGQSDGGFSGFLSGLLANSVVGSILGLGQKAARYVVSRFAGAKLSELTAYLHSMAGLWKAEFQAMRAEARATADVAQALERAIPIEAEKAAAPALRLGKWNMKRLTRFEAQTKPAIKRLSVAVDVTLPRDIAGVRQREEALSRDQAKLRERTSSLENGAVRAFDWIRTHPLSAVTGVFAGAVAVALGRLGLGGLNCRNNPFRNNPNACGLWSVLGRVLGLATFLTAAFDFPAFVDAAEVVAAGIGDVVASIEGTFELALPPLPAPA